MPDGKSSVKQGIRQTESRLHALVAGRRITCSLLDCAMPPPTLVAAVEHEEEGGSRLPGSEEETDPHGATPGRRTPPARLALLRSIWCRFRDE